MPNAEARIETEHASRYLVQLCRHAGEVTHRLGHLHAGPEGARPEVVQVQRSENDADATLELTWGRCTMRAGAHALTVRVEARDEENLWRVQDLIAADLRRFGRRENLTVHWRRPEDPTVQAGAAG